MMAKLRASGFDVTVSLVLPAALFMVALFVYPFLYGLVLSFRPMEGGWLANYTRFFSEPQLWPTIATTLKLALPATIVNVGLALPVAYGLRRKSRHQKLVTTLLVIPMTLGTVLVAEGMLTYFGPRGWLVRGLQLLHLYAGTVRLTHNYWGVLISLVISGFPFAFLLILSYITGIDPVLARAAATLGANPWRQFCHVYLPLLLPGLAMAFCLAFVQAFSAGLGAGVSVGLGGSVGWAGGSVGFGASVGFSVGGGAAVVALTLPENTHLRGLTLLPHGTVVNPMTDPAPWTAAYPPSTGWGRLNRRIRSQVRKDIYKIIQVKLVS